MENRLKASHKKTHNKIGMTMKRTICVVSIIKNEAAYLDEFICYHLAMGVSHFFFYDNGSDDNTPSVLRRYIQHGCVTHISWPKRGGQVDCYNHFLALMGMSVTWAAFIDIDEFIVPTPFDSISSMIDSFSEDVSEIRLPWRNFGFSDREDRPRGWVTEEFRMAENIGQARKERIQGKAIVRTSAVKMMYAHNAVIHSGTSVDGAGRPSAADIMIVNPDYSAPHVNHYYTKSVEEFTQKIARGQSDGGKEKRAFGLDAEPRNGEFDGAISRYVPAARGAYLKFMKYSENPGVYGRLMVDGFPKFDSTEWNINRALANAIDGVGDLRAVSRNLAAIRKGRLTVWSAGESEISSRDLLTNTHFKDFLRRCEIVNCAYLGQDNAELAWETNIGEFRTPFVLSLLRRQGGLLRVACKANGDSWVEEIDIDTFGTCIFVLVRPSLGYTDSMRVSISFEGVLPVYSLSLLQA